MSDTKQKPVTSDTGQSPLRVCLQYLHEGHEPAAALEFVADWGHGDVKRQFQTYVAKLKQGHPLTTILEEVADAFPAPDTELLLAAIQARIETGVFPAVATDILAEARALESQVRDDMEVLIGPGRRWTLGLVWVGILGGAMLLIALPRYSHTLLASPIGRGVFGIAIALEIFGFLWAATLLRLQTGIELELKRR